jgi:hypothetical protein
MLKFADGNGYADMTITYLYFFLQKKVALKTHFDLLVILSFGDHLVQQTGISYQIVKDQ